MLHNISIPLDIFVLFAFVFTFLGYIIGSWWQDVSVNGPMEKILRTYNEELKQLKKDYIDPADYWKNGQSEDEEY